MSSDTETQLKLARSRAERFKKAREEAERLLELKSRELYQANANLELAQKGLEEDVKQATYELSVSNQRLQKALNERSRFIGQMSHEVRTPLNAILGLSEILLSSELNKDQFDHVDTIHSAARSLGVLLNDMLDITKIEAGKLQINLESVDTHRIHKNVVSMFEMDAQAKGLSLELAMDESVPDCIRIDKGRYRQIMNNLVSNAIKNTEQGFVRVYISYRPRGYSETIGMLTVQVADSGVGIPENRLETIFNAYEQLCSPSQGVGLGLAICSQLCELMQGTIRCESTLGEGSQFEFSLPAEELVPNQSAANYGRHTDDTEYQIPLRILVAEDNPTNQKVLSAQLAQLGQTATIVNNGAEAMVCLQENTFDLVLLDILMPVMDGEQTIAAIRNADQRIAEHYCVALTASSYQDQRKRLLELGFDEFLAKPLSIDELIKTVRGVQAKISTRGQHAAKESGPAEESFDYTYLRSQFGDMCESIFIDIAPTFLEHTSGDLKKLVAAVAEGRTDATQKVSHSIKGGAASMGLTELASRLQQLEAQPDAPKALDWLETIEADWRVIEGQIRREISRLQHQTPA